jgi:hypothetical protein
VSGSTRFLLAEGFCLPLPLPHGRGLTRRHLLATGGLATAALASGARPWGPATAQAADNTPSYLIRSSYLRLSTQSFGTSLRGATADLTLLAVEDLPAAAAADKSLAASEDAFSLSFTSSAPLPPEIHTFSHPDLGVFDLFISPVENQGRYEVLVNRSVNAPKHYPPAPRSDSGPVAPPKPGAPPPPGAPKPTKSLVRRLRAHRAGRAVVADIAFEHRADLRWAVAWLSRRGVVVGSATARRVRGRNATLKVPFRKRLRGGRYELTVGTMDRHGHDEYKTTKIVLQ